MTNFLERHVTPVCLSACLTEVEQFFAALPFIFSLFYIISLPYSKTMLFFLLRYYNEMRETLNKRLNEHEKKLMHTHVHDSRVCQASAE